MMRAPRLALAPCRRLIVLVSFITLLLFIVLSSGDIKTSDKIHEEEYKLTAKDLRDSNSKYILLWTPEDCNDCAPFESFGNGHYAFRRINCQFQNCYITNNKSLLNDYTKYDMIVFNGRPVSRPTLIELPARRLPTQMYVFLQLESADRFPVCNPVYDNFFNRTFTYRLKSDYTWPYFNIVSLNGEIVGPKEKMEWMNVKDMKPVADEFKEKLRKKKKMAAWFVSNCRSRNHREEFVKQLQEELQRYNHTIDIYGECGPLKCPRSESSVCDRYLQEDYLFYLSLENSFSEDYVTEKLLTPLLNGAVPVVYGAADYSRFIPPGSYLNGRLLGPKRLAAAMLDIANDRSRYEDMFRWRQQYSYRATWPPPLCQLCEDLNLKPEKVKLLPKFREWWFPNYRKRCRNTNNTKIKAPTVLV